MKIRKSTILIAFGLIAFWTIDRLWHLLPIYNKLAKVEYIFFGIEIIVLSFFILLTAFFWDRKEFDFFTILVVSQIMLIPGPSGSWLLGILLGTLTIIAYYAKNIFLKLKINKNQ